MREEGDLWPAGASLAGLAPAHAERRPMVPCLGLVFPKDLQRWFKLGVEPRTIGSGHSADIVLNGEDIASVHCRISAESGEVLVEDLGSPSGTWVDGERVASRLLQLGQTLRIGHYQFVLGERPARAPGPGPARAQTPGTDRTAGIPNRAWILRRVARVLEARADSRRPVSLALLQVENMDDIRLRHGYRSADALLRSVAKLLESRLADKESIGLFGPEKLLLLLPEVDPDAAAGRLQELCTLMRGQSFDFGQGPLHVTLAAGYTTHAASSLDGNGPERLLGEAARALYRARRQGGDQVVAVL